MFRRANSASDAVTGGQVSGRRIPTSRAALASGPQGLASRHSGGTVAIVGEVGRAQPGPERRRQSSPTPSGPAKANPRAGLLQVSARGLIAGALPWLGGRAGAPEPSLAALSA